MGNKVILAKVRISGGQKRVNVPKQAETEGWEDGDLIKLELVEL